jgi:peroxiredoxin
MGMLAAAPTAAQQPAQSAATPLTVGTTAPGFNLAAGNKDGLAGMMQLADLHDKTVVIAFFYRARSRG